MISVTSQFARGTNGDEANGERDEFLDALYGGGYAPLSTMWSTHTPIDRVSKRAPHR